MKITINENLQTRMQSELKDTDTHTRYLQFPFIAPVTAFNNRVFTRAAGMLQQFDTILFSPFAKSRILLTVYG